MGAFLTELRFAMRRFRGAPGFAFVGKFDSTGLGDTREPDVTIATPDLLDLLGVHRQFTGSHTRDRQPASRPGSDRTLRTIGPSPSRPRRLLPSAGPVPGQVHRIPTPSTERP